MTSSGAILLIADIDRPNGVITHYNVFVNSSLVNVCSPCFIRICTAVSRSFQKQILEFKKHLYNIHVLYFNKTLKHRTQIMFEIICLIHSLRLWAKELLITPIIVVDNCYCNYVTSVSLHGNGKIIIVITRKHRQSYRHADPRRQRPQVAQQHIGLRTNRQTRLNTLPTPAAMPVWVINILAVDRKLVFNANDVKRPLPKYKLSKK